MKTNRKDGEAEMGYFADKASQQSGSWHVPIDQYRNFLSEVPQELHLDISVEMPRLLLSDWTGLPARQNNARTRARTAINLPQES